MRTAWLLSMGFLIASQGGCDSSPGGGGPSEDTGGDTDTPKNPEYPEFGEVCRTNDDCEAGICSLWSDQSDERFCATPCSDNIDCQELENASCFTVPDLQGDIARVCAPTDLCIDPDEDGYGVGPGCLGFDCDQNNPNVHPGAPERCNGIDDNCNGQIDENPVGEGTACDTGFIGICSTGRNVCTGGSLQCAPTVLPGERQEICNGQDDDCDGLVDEGPSTDSNGNYVIGIGQPCGEEGSLCYLGPKTCTQIEVDGKTSWTLTCSLDNPFSDVPDLCDGIDNNCNGLIDEDYEDPNYKQACRVGIGTCEGIGYYDCDPNDPSAPSICNAEERPQNSMPEICDYNDNDCDGIIDNGFVNANGVYDQIEHCGQCDFDCNNLWQDPNARATLTPICKVTASTARCDFECKPDTRNLDGIRENGCEFTIDRQAIYVSHSTSGGMNNGTCGDYDSPCATIVYGLQRATAENKLRVRVTEGIFQEAITLTSGVSIIGGHSPRTWEENPARFITTIRGSQNKADYQVAVLAENITTATRVAGVSVEGPNADPGKNSVALLIVDSNAQLRIENVNIQAGDGGRGEKGADGSNGRNGVNGSSGKDVMKEQPSCSNPPLLGGAGGALAANFEGQTIAVNGGSGTNSNCPTSGSATEVGPDRGRAGPGQGPQTPAALGGQSRSNYFISGNGGCNYTSGTVGSPQPGENGLRGQNASQAGSGATDGTGTVTAGTLPLWRGASGGRGRDGQPGNGGGGGGAMGGIHRSSTNINYGPTGGGGGSGAEGGAAGQGGTAGGASFGILIIQTAPGVTAANYPAIENNQSFRGRGGQGGSGGQGGGGGQGGSGGSGGSPLDVGACSQVGGQGGRGGNGGHGSGGGGGAGGASYDIAVIARSASNSATITARYQSNTFHDGPSTVTGGLGGSGGSSPSLTGTAGTTGASGTVRVWSY